MTADETLRAPYRLDPLHEQMLSIALCSDGRASARWRALRRDVDLDALWDTRALQFLPLVYHALVEEGSDDPDLPRLRGVQRRTWYENQLRLHWLGGALHVLVEDGVDAMPLKGIVLATSFYQNVGLRPMVDCDVLVRTDQLEQALDVLRRAGWEPTGPLPTRYARHGHEVDVADAARHLIDLHWHLAPWLVHQGDEVDGDDQFWDRSVSIDIGGVSARSLDRSDLLLHVIVNGAKEGYATAPQWVADAVMIARAEPGVDWRRLTETAQSFGVAFPVRRALQYLRVGFAAPVPSSALADLDVPVGTRSRRMFTRAAQGGLPSPVERRVLGPLASTYRYWIACSAPLTRARAVATFPVWLADHWGLGGPRQLPAGIARRVARRVSQTARNTRRDA